MKKKKVVVVVLVAAIISLLVGFGYWWYISAPAEDPIAQLSARVDGIDTKVVELGNGVAANASAINKATEELINHIDMVDGRVGNLEDRANDFETAMTTATNDRESLHALLANASGTVKAEQARRILAENEALLIQAEKLGVDKIKELISEINSTLVKAAIKSAKIGIEGEVTDIVPAMNDEQTNKVLRALLTNGRRDIESMIIAAYANMQSVTTTQVVKAINVVNNEVDALDTKTAEIEARVVDVTDMSQAQIDALMAVTEPSGRLGHSLPRANKEAARAAIADFVGRES